VSIPRTSQPTTTSCFRWIYCLDNMFCLFYTSLFIFFSLSLSLSLLLLSVVIWTVTLITFSIVFSIVVVVVVVLRWGIISYNVTLAGLVRHGGYMCTVLQSLIIAPRTRLLSGQRTTYIFCSFIHYFFLYKSIVFV
jgi:hypothetical protein